VYGWLSCPADKRFLGLIGQNGGDQAFYLGWGPKQAQNGHVLFEDKYNGYADRRPVFNPLWLVMGWTARATGLSVLAIFHVERLIFSGLLLLAAYRLIAIFVPGPPWRLLALAVVGLSSGLGAFLVPRADWGSPSGIFAISPERWTPDLWVIESNVFLTMLWEVVLPCATALFFLTMNSAFRSLWQRKGSAVPTGVLALVLGAVYPYAVVAVDLILLGVVLLKLRDERAPWKLMRDYVVVAAISAPVVLYDAYLVFSDPRLTTGQAGYASPGPLKYLVGFGVIGLLSFIGAWPVVRQRVQDAAFLFVWIGVTFVAIYIPRAVIPFQMQLILGVQLPLAVLAVFGWKALVTTTTRTWPGTAGRVAALTLGILLAGLSTITSAYHFHNVFVSLERKQLPEYIDRDLEEAIAWLAGHTDESAVVLSSPEVAPYVPVLANNRMFSGNYEAPTANFPEKLKAIEWLVRADIAKSDAEIARFLDDHRIDYVFFDGSLQRRGGDGARGRLDAVPALQAVFENPAARIYRVRRSPS
jgi:hypothetical protein